jgi:hypothetical protein
VRTAHGPPCPSDIPKLGNAIQAVNLLLVKIARVALVALVALCIGTCSSLAYYDLSTEKNVYRVIQRELPAHASMDMMNNFMKRHAGSVYNLDEEYDPEFVGMLPQTTTDRILFDRRVEITLKFDRKNKTLQRSAVAVTYTFL